MIKQDEEIPVDFKKKKCSSTPTVAFISSFKQLPKCTALEHKINLLFSMMVGLILLCEFLDYSICYPKAFS